MIHGTMDSDYDNYGLEPLPEIKSSLPSGLEIEEYIRLNIPYQVGQWEVVMDQMRRLGFSKVQSHCVYKGPVAKLVAALMAKGWRHVTGHRNPFLLEYPECCWFINYAETAERASKQYLSFFRG